MRKGSKENGPRAVVQANPRPVPIGRWFHLEAHYVESSGSSGSIRMWQDGALILEAEDVKTLIVSGENTVWGIGNYTDHIAGGPVEGNATVYFDDAIVSTERIGTAVPEPGAAVSALAGFLALSACAHRSGTRGRRDPSSVS